MFYDDCPVCQYWASWNRKPETYEWDDYVLDIDEAKKMLALQGRRPLFIRVSIFKKAIQKIFPSLHTSFNCLDTIETVSRWHQATIYSQPKKIRCETHVYHVPLEDPIIMADIGGWFVADGIHRIARAVKDNMRNLRMHMLTREEVRVIMRSRNESEL